jgi:hypothetical protein
MTNKVCVEGKYAKLSRMRVHDAHLFIEYSPTRQGNGESRTD